LLIAVLAAFTLVGSATARRSEGPNCYRIVAPKRLIAELDHRS
jgi:hypothetical protein